MLQNNLKRRGLLTIFILVALSACTTAPYRPVPDSYTGATAYIEDSYYQESGGKGRIFALTAVDDNRIESAFNATRRASAGQGFALTMVSASRHVMAKKQKFTLTASHITAAPIQALTTTMLETSKEVEFAPEADKRYVVKGQLRASGSSVWIEELDSGKRVTE